MSSTMTTVERSTPRQPLAEIVAESAGRVRDSLRQGSTRVRAGSRKVASAADTYVHDRPWSALGLAAAVGLVVGVLAKRR